MANLNNSNDNAFWARPNSSAENTAGAPIRNVQDNNAKAVSPPDSVPNGEAEFLAPADDNANTVGDAEASRYDKQDKQVDFFNSMSGVETARTEYNEIYTPTSLLEVPFNDTPHSIGYTIPKIRLSLTKQSKRRIIAFSSIFSCIAVLIAAVIILNGIFGFIPTVKQTPIMYTKGGKVYLTSSTGRVPEQIEYDGNALQIVSNSGGITFSAHNDDVIVAYADSGEKDTYSLYLRKGMRVSEKGELIDSNVLGDYEYALGSKAILYIKNKGTNDLYLYRFSSKETVRIDRKIKMFGMLSDDTAVYISANGDIKTARINRDGSFELTEIAKSARQLYIDSEPCGDFYYIKSERNTDTSADESNLYRYSNGKSDKIANCADSLVAYSCVDNWAYFAHTVSGQNDIFQYIDDDCADGDNALAGSAVGIGANLTDEVMAAIRRNTIRKNSEKTGIKYSYTTISYYHSGELTEIESSCAELCAVRLDTDFVSLKKSGKLSDYNANKSGLPAGKSAGIMYKSTVVSDSLPKFSDIPTAILNPSTFHTYIVSQIETNVLKTSACVIANGKRTVVGTNDFRNNTVAFSPDYANFYYIDIDKGSGAVQDIPDTPESDTGSNKNSRPAQGASSRSSAGDLICVPLDASEHPTYEPIAVEVEQFTVLSDGSVLYVNSDRTAYVGTVALANRVSSIKINNAGTVAAILSDTSDIGSRLTVYREGAVKAIADNVSSVVFNDDSTVSFIKDYDKVTARGDIYVCRNFTSPARIDSDVSLLIEYPY